MTAEFAVSIAIPVWNGARHLASCLDSVLAQDWAGSLEIVVVDDASTDGSLDIVRERHGANTPLRVVRNPHRLGIARSTNRAVREARGQWIKFVYQDDTITRNCLSALAPYFNASGPGIVVGRRRYNFESGATRWRREACQMLLKCSLHESFPDSTQLTSSQFMEEILGEYPISMNLVGEPIAVAVRRSDFLMLGGMDSRLHQLLDYEMWIRLALHGGIALVHKEISEFTVHAESATARNYSERQFETEVLDALGTWLLVASRLQGGSVSDRSALRQRVRQAMRGAVAATALAPNPTRAARSLARFAFEFRSELAGMVRTIR